MVWVPRATITPEGDYLVLFPYDRGRWYQGKEMLAMRSSDKGKTWSELAVVFDSSQSHHGFVPLIPRGSKRIYAFGTQPISGMVGDGKKGLQENCPIGFRYSDDDGHTWSDVTLIRPENDPEFTGMSCVRMCETDAGTWLIGSHDGIWRRKGSPAPVTTRQYILRGEDKGKTWQLLPGKRPGGWCIEKYDRMDEGTVLSLGGAKAVVFIRTAEGRIWESRSDDDGKTWTDPKPTELVHPDAPPMVFHLGDAKTLIAFIHNRYDPRRPHFDKAARNEVWCSLSKDEGRTWSEPRFVFAGANPEGHIHSNSYLDMIADGSRIHVFLGQKGRQLLYLQFDESDLSTFMTKAGLAAAMKPSPETADGVERTALFQAGEDGYAVFRIPGIVVTAKGTVLAYCVGRKTPGDWADIDIFLRRSADGGKTWEPGEGIRLYRWPIKEIELLYTDTHKIGKTALKPGANPLADINGELLDIYAEIEMGSAEKVVFNLRGSTVTYDGTKLRNEPNLPKPPDSRRGNIEMKPQDGKINVRSLVDRASIETFGNDGRVSLTDFAVHEPGNLDLSLTAEGGEAVVHKIVVHELESAWE